MDDLIRARETLIEKNYSCVFVNEEKMFCSKKRGIMPLIEFLESDKDFSGFSAADKTVGAGAAHLYVLLGVKAVWAKVISEIGIKILEENGFSVVYENKVPYIINRAGNGQCPIEKSVDGVEDSGEALEIIKNTLYKLKERLETK